MKSSFLTMIFIYYNLVYGIYNDDDRRTHILEKEHQKLIQFNINIRSKNIINTKKKMDSRKYERIKKKIDNMFLRLYIDIDNLIKSENKSLIFMAKIASVEIKRFCETVNTQLPFNIVGLFFNTGATFVDTYEKYKPYFLENLRIMTSFDSNELSVQIEKYKVSILTNMQQKIIDLGFFMDTFFDVLTNELIIYISKIKKIIAEMREEIEIKLDILQYGIKTPAVVIYITDKEEFKVFLHNTFNNIFNKYKDGLMTNLQRQIKKYISLVNKIHIENIKNNIEL